VGHREPGRHGGAGLWGHLQQGPASLETPHKASELDGHFPWGGFIHAAALGAAGHRRTWARVTRR
jgi:hypothetical protein